MDADVSTEEGPSEVILKLAFTYLEFEQLISHGELVCKRWRNILRSDDEVWRPICDRDIEWRQRRLSFSNIPGDEEYRDYCHKILVTEMAKSSISGRSYREIFILSRRMGRALSRHRAFGPDHHQGDQKSLRENINRDFRFYVAPTIETLRQVFSDHDVSGRRKEIAEIKGRLLVHARGASMLKRTMPTELEKENIATIGGEYMLAASAVLSKSFDENPFISSSVIETTFGEIIEGMASISGKELKAPISVELERSATGRKMVHKFNKCHHQAGKRLKGSLNDLDWPLNPVDIVSALISKLWLREQDLIERYDEWPIQDKTWESELKPRWSSLPEPVRKLILSTFQDLAAEYNSKSLEVPVETLKLIAEADYHLFRRRIACVIWSDMDPELCDTILKMYLQHSNDFCEMVRQEYHQIYMGKDPEFVAKLLLDIILETACDDVRHKFCPEMTVNYCNGLLEKMANEMDRWNQLVDSAQNNNQALWDPQIMNEILAVESKFLSDVDKPRKQRLFPEFSTDVMVNRFFHQTFSSTGQEDCPNQCVMLTKVISTYDEFMKQYQTQVENGVDTTVAVSANVTRIEEVVRDYKTLSAFIHTREHAAMSLIPLLSALSISDSKRLVYALFAEKNNDWMVRNHSRAFSKEVDKLTDYRAGYMPCSTDSFQDNVMNIAKWRLTNSFPKDRCDTISELLFRLPLPENIVTAMASFMLERLYHESPYDVNSVRYRNAFGVLPYMKRFAYENPRKASIVWDCLGQAIANSVEAVQEFNVDDIENEYLRRWQYATETLLDACMATGAKSAIPTIRLFYEATEDLQPEDRLPEEEVIERMNQAGRVIVDSICFGHFMWFDNI